MGKLGYLAELSVNKTHYGIQPLWYYLFGQTEATYFDPMLAGSVDLAVEPDNNTIKTLQTNMDEIAVSQIEPIRIDVSEDSPYRSSSLQGTMVVAYQRTQAEVILQVINQILRHRSAHHRGFGGYTMQPSFELYIWLGDNLFRPPDKLHGCHFITGLSSTTVRDQITISLPGAAENHTMQLGNVPLSINQGHQVWVPPDPPDYRAIPCSYTLEARGRQRYDSYMMQSIHFWYSGGQDIKVFIIFAIEPEGIDYFLEPEMVNVSNSDGLWALSKESTFAFEPGDLNTCRYLVVSTERVDDNTKDNAQDWNIDLGKANKNRACGHMLTTFKEYQGIWSHFFALEPGDKEVWHEAHHGFNKSSSAYLQ